MENSILNFHFVFLNPSVNVNVNVKLVSHKGVLFHDHIGPDSLAEKRMTSATVELKFDRVSKTFQPGEIVSGR